MLIQGRQCAILAGLTRLTPERAAARLERCGARVATEPVDDLRAADLLVAGPAPTPADHARARALGACLIDEDAFLDRFAVGLNVSDRLARLRALLHADPSRDAWARVCQLFDCWPARDDLDMGLRYALDHLGAWPDHLRTTPARWLTRRLHTGQPEPLLTLAATLTARYPTPATPDALLALPELHHITALDLSYCELTADQLTSILQQLRHLDAPITRLDLAYNSLERDSARALASSPALAHLTHLNLRSNYLDAAGAEAIASSDRLTRLTHLDLHDNAIGDQGVAALTESPALARLTHLGLQNNRIGPDGAAALTRATFAPHLHTLDLKHNELGPDGARRLCAPKSTLRALRALDLSANEIGDEGVAAIAAAPPGPLTHLSLEGNFIQPLITATGAHALANAEQLAGLTHLNLSQNPLGPDGLAALAHGASLGALTHLTLSYVKLQPGDLGALKDAPFTPRLRALDLSGNPLGDDGASALARAPLTSTRILRLGYCTIGTPGALALIDADALAQVEHLDLFHNPVQDAAVERLAQLPRWSNLHTLILYRAELTDTSAFALAQSPHLTRLRSLVLDANSLSAEGIYAVRNALGFETEADPYAADTFGV